MAKAVCERSAVSSKEFIDLVTDYRPVVLRGQMARWPAVQAANRSNAALAEYLGRFDTGKPTELLVGPHEIDGRYFYNSELTGCNFQKRSVTLSALLRHLLTAGQGSDRSFLYAGAAETSEHLSGWSSENGLNLPASGAKARIWVGNASHVSTHFDEASNIAVVVAGRRRFTLFPPEQLDNLYVGPLHFTIAGPPVSMVDPYAPDLERFPRYREAERHALVTELEPGDAIYIPPIWWHDVRTLEPFNVMVNHWWEPEASQSPLAALIQTIRAVRDLPPAHRAAWQHWFTHFAFDENAPHAADHLPPHAKGVAGPPSLERDAFLKRQDAARIAS